MQIIQSKNELRKAVKSVKRKGKTIGFVPTMGFLHQGHLSLIRRAREENDIVVVSIFVNPTQFGPNEDLDAYPRDAQRDSDLMVAETVDIAFYPTVDALYPKGYTTYVEVQGPMTQVLCGRSRPTHFRGVTTIVTKLFNLVSPDRAYFGQKDAQQATVIQQMVRDLDFDLQVVVCPIVREADGMAMSSRNTYLTPGQRADAPMLNRALLDTKEMIEKGERSVAVVSRNIEKQISGIEDATIDYVAVVNAHTLEEMEMLSGEMLVALAVKFGRTRLIDNIRIEV
ncbi:pantoate--beta-alanine ligase [Desulfosarcina ovata]|uniref:Pantothenate synthetase n=1 Tax=Desulfosarcina ovata subsp. ovata TaxID=2752305 RepID=A0A5K8A7E0_9BACT|nr:pantoate--beta-alanine ligase [Desulfosarcina ovata]BBO88060.1 pantothenate synthetase [Desulfosarcina ovata subsp. ovata]